MPAVRLLNTPGIFLGDERVEIPQGKTSALLYYLAYQADWVSRDDLLYLFWPDTEELKARRNLRQLLSVIRKLPFTYELETTEQRVRWCVPSDSQVFKEALEKKQWAKATECYGGSLLEGFQAYKYPEFETWLEFERASLSSSYRSAVLTLSEELKRERRFLQAAEVLAKLHRFDPLDEQVLQHYLNSLALSRKQSEALSVYETFARTLTLELNTEPTLPTQTLIAKIRSGEALEAEVSTPYASPSNDPVRAQKKLPMPSTHFVGRETELAQFMALMGDPACRLLNLVGAGGMGKTRLAIEAAGRLEAHFVEGSCFVPFETVVSTDLMITAIAEALNFTFLGQQNPKEQLFTYLANKQMLIVADNLEQLAGDATVLSDLLEHAPRIKILATSRQTLNLHAEWVFDVKGMSVTQMHARENHQENDAVRLFLQTAKKTRGHFELSEQNREAVIGICQAVGGMPLAIELAASWLRVLTPQAILAELDRGLETISGAARDMPERHHSIEAVFASSWQRLNAAEQEALKYLSVFHGGFSKESAQAITEVSLPMLLSLSNKSFVRCDDTGRFTQHPLVWQFAREKAESVPDFDAIQENHAVYFAAFLKEREEGHERLHAKAVRQEISRELPNVLAAWEWMVESGREDLLEQALWSLCEYYRGENRFQEGEALFSRAEKQLPKDSLMRARLLHRSGIFNNLLGTYDRGLNALNESLRISKKHKAAWEEAHALFVWILNRGMVNEVGEEAAGLYQKCADIFNSAGDAYHEARALGNLSDFVKNLNKREQMMRYCIGIFRETQGFYGLSLMLNKLAFAVSESHGDYEEAIELLEEAIAIERQRDNPMRLALFLDTSGRILTHKGSYYKAERHFKESLLISRKFDIGRGIFKPGQPLHGIGWLAYLQEDLTKAKTYLQESLTLGERRNDPLDSVEALNALCRVAIAQEQFNDALHLCDRTQSYLETTKRSSQFRLYLHLFHLENLAKIALSQDRANAALLHLQDAFQLSQKWDLRFAQLDLLLSYNDLLMQQGKDGKSATLLSFISNHKVTVFATREKAKERFASLPKRIREKAVEQSQLLRLEQVIADCLKG